MIIAHDSRLRDLAVHALNALPILEETRIDYFCAGDETLEEGCRRAGIDVQALRARLESAAAAPGRFGEEDWSGRSLVDLIAHIDARYHRVLPAEIERLRALALEVTNAEPALLALEPLFRDLRDETAAHGKAVISLFADLMTLQAGAAPASMSLPPLAKVARDVQDQHRRLCALLREIDRILQDGRSVAAERLREALADWEREAHRHAHLENNVLIPRSLELDPAANRRAAPATPVEPAEIRVPSLRAYDDELE
jgi:regulator of cell morphogenesis and NO signaling